MGDALTVAGMAIAPLAWYCLVMGMTPGPNNLMLAASGMNFGLRRTLPHIGGVLAGFCSLIFLAGLGAGALFEMLPLLQVVLRWAGAAFLLYLAWRIAGASRTEHPEDARPLRFVEAAAFQFANPKAWVFSITAAASFLGSGGIAGAGVLAVAGMCITLLSTTTWTLFGAGLARWIASEHVQRRVNLAFSAALVATIPLLVMD